MTSLLAVLYKMEEHLESVFIPLKWTRRLTPNSGVSCFRFSKQNLDGKQAVHVLY